MSRKNLFSILFITALLISLCFPAYSQLPARTQYKGVVQKSDKRKVNEQFLFANLISLHPLITFPSGSGSESTKVYEDNELIVLIYVGNQTGSTETFYLNKKTGRFTLIEVGALEAIVSGTDIKPTVTYGKLQ